MWSGVRGWRPTFVPRPVHGVRVRLFPMTEARLERAYIRYNQKKKYVTMTTVTNNSRIPPNFTVAVHFMLL